MAIFGRHSRRRGSHGNIFGTYRCSRHGVDLETQCAKCQKRFCSLCLQPDRDRKCDVCDVCSPQEVVLEENNAIFAVISIVMDALLHAEFRESVFCASQCLKLFIDILMMIVTVV